MKRHGKARKGENGTQKRKITDHDKVKTGATVWQLAGIRRGTTDGTIVLNLRERERQRPF